MSDFKITGPGKYRTRSGEVVDISGPEDRAGYLFHGYAWQGRSGNSEAIDAWRSNGRYYAEVEDMDDLDIIERIDVAEPVLAEEHTPQAGEHSGLAIETLEGCLEDVRSSILHTRRRCADLKSALGLQHGELEHLLAKEKSIADALETLKGAAK